jgi:hypothetical protein
MIGLRMTRQQSSGYQDGGSIAGVFTTTEPFPVRLQLGQLP